MKNSSNNAVEANENLYINDIAPLYINNQGRVSFNLDLFSQESQARNSILNFTGYCFSDMKHNLFKAVATSNDFFDTIITNTDFLSMDHLSEFVQEWTNSGKHIIIFYVTEYDRSSTASPKRCKKSAEELVSRGLKNVYFCQGLKEVKACLKQIKGIDVKFYNAHKELIDLKKNICKKEYSSKEAKAISSEVIKKNKPKFTLIHCNEAA